MEDLFLCFSILVCLVGWSANFLQQETGTIDVKQWVDYSKNNLYDKISTNVYQHQHLKKKIFEPRKNKNNIISKPQVFSDEFDIENQGFTLVD